MRHLDDVLDRAAHYASRGRAYRSVPDLELAGRWIEAFRGTVSQPANESFRLAEQDLFAEHQLRRLQLPYHAVLADREHLVAQIMTKLGQLNRGQLAVLKRRRASRGRAQDLPVGRPN